MSKKIVHVVAHDKFTAGYINFMKMCMKEYDHAFIVSNNKATQDGGIEGKLIDEVNVVVWSSYMEIAFGKKIRDMLLACDKVILSGFFGMEEICTCWPGSVFKKTYIHFWGGDFYELRYPIPRMQLRARERRILKKRCLRRCAGVIFLIEGEYDKFYDITHIKKDKKFVAAMPRSPREDFSFNNYRNHAANEMIKIVVGNSAAKENRHIEVLQMLERFRGEKMEVYCPLSYGDADYGQQVIHEGNKILGEKFHAITEWMKKEDYYDFLSTCDIGIFNNDRQQGMANIRAMLFMGKKIYLRSDVDMYDHFKNRGFKIDPVSEIDTCTFEQLKNFDSYEQNIRAADNWDQMEERKEAWGKVFES